MAQSGVSGWDRGYEVRAVLLLSIGFGLVGLDRFIINPLAPTMMKDLGLDYQDLGLLTSLFSIAWGLSALFMGGISDRIGRRKVLIPSVILFSLLAGTSGLAGGILGLIAIRAMMGLFEGAYTPASIAATIEASRPSRRGMNIGIQQASMTVFGLGFGPIVATQLLLWLPSWREVFLIASIPGFLCAWAMWHVLRNTEGTLDSAADDEPSEGRPHWSSVFGHRNVPLNMFGMCCMLTCFLVTATMAPSYLIDVLGLETQQMGYVLSAIGFGACAGQLLLPGLSDRIGRKPVVIGCYIGCIAALLLFLAAPANPGWLFTLLFAISFFNNSMICLNVGPLTGEAVPAALTATATGLVVGIGELIGGGFAPGVAGHVAQNYGLHRALEIGLIGLVLGLIAALFLRETAPRVLARRAAA